MLLRYGLVTGSGRRGVPQLLSLAVGAVLSCGFAVAAPADILPASWRAVSGTAALRIDEPAPPAAPRPPAASEPATGPAPAPPLATGTAEPPPPPTTTAAPASAPTSTPAPSTSTSTTSTTTTTSSSSAKAQPPTTTPTPAPPPPAADGSVAQQVAAATNAERRAAGCPALETDARLAAAAQGHAADMAENGYFSHEGQDGRDFADRISAQGHPSPGGENIAQGQPDAAAVVQAWMDSPGHRANILNCSFTGIGVGHAGQDDYWVQNFGR